MLCEFSGTFLFTGLDEHILNGEMCVFVRLLKDTIICFLNSRSKDGAQLPFERHSEGIEMRTLLGSCWITHIHVWLLAAISEIC